MQRGAYARSRLAEIGKVVTPVFDAPHFKEFVVDFDGTSKSVGEINAALRARGIYGGKDLTAEFPELGKSALFCVTEIHRKQDIDRLVASLAEVLR
jgi:glycine dehydrogenase subunit 1